MSGKKHESGRRAFVRKNAAVLLVIALVLPAFLALADGKTRDGDITGDCSFEVSSDTKHWKNLKSEDYASYWTGEPGASVCVMVKSGKNAGGVTFSFHSDPAVIRAEDNRTGEVLGEYSGIYENGHIVFSKPSASFRLINVSGSGSVEISKLSVFSEGVVPSWVQRWTVMEGNADLMLVSTHPDDELLWFGGMLPYYAGELNKKVIVVYMVGGNSPKRRNELLDGLWTCGVTFYPEIGYFPDKGASSLSSTVRSWGEGAAQQRITEMIRKYRPLVVVSQDIKGEYGHFHHIATVQAVIDNVTGLSSNPDYDHATAQKYGIWAPLKLYLHLYRENPIIFDWNVPLSAFGGETGLEIARKAFKMHISQQTGKYTVSDSGRLDCRLFGLYYSAVGEDEIHNDLFENILPVNEMAK